MMSLYSSNYLKVVIFLTELRKKQCLMKFSLEKINEENEANI